MTTVPDTIRTRFTPWHSCRSWVVCGADKIPLYRTTYRHLRWVQDPDSDSFMDFENVCKWSRVHEGFGIFLGIRNNLAAFDLDDCLDTNGNIINPEVAELLQVLYTFTEISSSGTGLHAIIAVDDNVDVPEFGFKKSFCGGKYYPERFLKLTGIPYKDYDVPIKVKSQSELLTIRNKIVEPQQTPDRPKTAYTAGSNESWDAILTRAGIMHVSVPEYVGKTRNNRTIVEAYKLVCPNRAAHQTDRKGDPSAHLAILTKDTDGRPALTCNHNSCRPESRPNLLLKLWSQIRKDAPIVRMRRETTARLKALGVL